MLNPDLLPTDELTMPSPISDAIVHAAVTVQGIMAEMLGDCTYEFARLSEQQQDSALISIVNYQALSSRLLTPAHLHDINMEKLIKAGWSKGELDIENKHTPMLCDFHQLPGKAQAFIQAMFAVLETMVFNIEEASA